VAFLVSVVVATEPLVGLAEDGRLLWAAADLALGAAAFVLVYHRRRWPVGVALAIALMGIVSGLTAGPAVLALVSVATRRRWAEVVPVAAVLVLSGHFYSLVVPQEAAEPVWLTVLVGVALGGGCTSAPAAS